MMNRIKKIFFPLLIFLLANAAFGIPWRGDVNISPGLIPRPVSQEFAQGYFSLGAGTVVTAEGDAEFGLRRYLEEHLRGSIPDIWKYSISLNNNMVRLVMPSGKDLPSEGYRLTVESDTISIEANDRGGLFYGIQTLLQLLPPEIYSSKAITEPYSIPCQTITDYPLLRYRGMMLDVSRTFCDKETVIKFIDRMARHKLNRFHWHLTDDEGWRIEIKSYPELAIVGGFRGGDSPVRPIYGEWDKKYGGYFTQDDIREVVAYAAFRNVEVIPEIDLPGHSRAAAKIFPSILCGVNNDKPALKSDRRNVWCASKDSNYKMLDNILGEVAGLFPSDYIHIGGDEVMLGQWKGCAQCKALMGTKGYKDAKQLTNYFVSRVSEVLKKYGKTPVVWDEASEGATLDKNSVVAGWQGVKQCLRTTADDYRTIVVPGDYFYFDMRQSADEDGMTWATIVDTKRVYSFGFSRTGFDQERMKNVEGVEATFFSELLLSHTPQYLDYQIYPRLCALAEVAWLDESLRDWDDFYARLTKNHLERLDAMGISYRMFPPSVDYSKGMVTATLPFAGVEIRYTDNESEPHRASALYDDPIIVSDPTKYRFKAFYGNASSPTVKPVARAKFMIAANSAESFEIPLSDIIDSIGLWYFRIKVPDSNMKVDKISVTSDGKSSNIVGYTHNVNQIHRMRLYANDNNRYGTMNVKMRNLNGFDCEAEFIFELSPYIEPAVKFTSSLTQNSRFPFKNLEDYNFSTYSRTSSTCNKGDMFTYTFAEPVDAQSIEIITGLSYMPRYHLPEGRVLISEDGSNFYEVGVLSAGRAVIYPENIVKTVRIVSDSDGNSENAVALHDLRIKPRKK